MVCGCYLDTFQTCKFNFPTLKKKELKKKSFKGLLSMTKEKEDRAGKQWREACHWGGKAEPYYGLEICKTVTNSIIAFKEVSRDHILPFIHPHNTRWWESALCCSWIFRSHLFCVTCLFLLILVKWVVHPHVSSHEVKCAISISDDYLSLWGPARLGLPASVHLTCQSFYCNLIKWGPIQFRGALRNKLDLNGA